MELDTLVAHYHEIGLKGRNRNFFEDALARNMRRALRGTGYLKLRQGFGRVVVDMKQDGNIEAAAERVARVFGLAYVGVGKRVAPDMGAIADAALQLIRADPFESFQVRARRTHSSFDRTSTEINIEIGQRIVDETGGKVDLKNADATIHIELFGNA